MTATNKPSTETPSAGDGRNARPNPPKRPQRRKDARPAEIIEAGLKEFAENGFAATRLEDVATRAGIVKGTIYRYFDSKEALFEAAVRSRVVSTLDDVGALIDGFPGPTEDLLRMVLRTIYEKVVASDVPILMRIIIAEGARFPEIVAYYHRQSVSKGQALLNKIIERGIARGEFRAGPASELPIVVVAPAIVAAIWKMTFEPYQPIALETFLDAHMDIVFNGLKRD